MARIQIGKRTVEVGDNFLQLTPEQQQQTVNEIAGQIGEGPPQHAPATNLAAHAPAAMPPVETNVADKRGLDEMAAQDRSGVDLPSAMPRYSPMTQGMTLNAADEMFSGAQAPFQALLHHFTGGPTSIGENYDQNQAQAQRDQELFRRDHPVKEIAGQVAGSAALPIPGAGPGAGLLKRAAVNGLAGAGYGAVSGFNDGNGLEDRMNQATTGAEIGGAVGATIPFGAKIFGGIKLLSNLLRETPTEFAARKVERAASKTGNDALGAISDLAEAKKFAPDMNLTDALGEPGARLAKAVLNNGGEGAQNLSDTFLQRQLGQGDRLTGRIQKAAGDPASYHGSLEDATNALKTKAAPFYESAKNQPIDYAQFSALEDMFKNRVPDSAIAEANKIMRLEGVKSKQILRQEQPDGTFADSPLPDMTQWNYIKQGLDSLINGTDGKGVGGGVTPQGKAAIGLKDEILSNLDQAVPDFGTARGIFKDDLAVKKAFEEGRAAFSADPEEIVKHMSTLDEAAKKAYLIGLARDAAGKVDSRKLTGDALNRIWNTPKLQKVWKSALGDGTDFNVFSDVMNQEGVMSGTFNKIRGNSTTAQQLGDMADSAQSLLGETLVRATTRGPWNAAFGVGSKLINKAGGMTDKNSKELSKVLASDGADLSQTILKQRKQDEMYTTLRNLVERFAPRAAVAAPN